MRYQTFFPTIPQSGAVSGDIGLRAGGILIGLWAPVVTSCQLFLQAAFDQVSANFVRVANPAGSGAWTFAVGPGSAAVSLIDPLLAFPFARIETSVPQTDVRTFALICKL